MGEYAWPVVQAVEGPKNNFSGGMEYPMITLITSPDAKPESLDGVIAHEVGHNWFMGFLGSNERMHGWMDEGMNSFFQFRYEAQKYRSNSVFGDDIPADVKNNDAEKFEDIIYGVMQQAIPFEDEMDIHANEHTTSDVYALAVYVKTALWLKLIEASAGKEKTRLAIHNYFDKWKFKHPQPEDMQAAFEEVIGPLDYYFNLTKKKGKLE